MSLLTHEPLVRLGCFLGVLVFHFPQYLSTPELRRSYNVDVMRMILLAAMVIAGGLSLVNIIFDTVLQPIFNILVGI